MRAHVGIESLETRVLLAAALSPDGDAAANGDASDDPGPPLAPLPGTGGSTEDAAGDVTMSDAALPDADAALPENAVEDSPIYLLVLADDGTPLGMLALGGPVIEPPGNIFLPLVDLERQFGDDGNLSVVDGLVGENNRIGVGVGAVGEIGDDLNVLGDFSVIPEVGTKVNVSVKQAIGDAGITNEVAIHFDDQVGTPVGRRFVLEENIRTGPLGRVD